jgi:hypothetical protein
MNPLEQKVQELERRLTALERVENIAFIESMLRRIVSRLSVGDLPPISLNDLSDVDVPTPSDGQVLKYTTSGVDRWIAGTDNVV